MHGHFNLPDNIIEEEHEHHISTLSWIWLNVIRGHDTDSHPTNLKKELDLSDKLPKITSKSYYKMKRKMKKQTIKNQMWNKTVISIKRLIRRTFANRGK